MRRGRPCGPCPQWPPDEIAALQEAMQTCTFYGDGRRLVDHFAELVGRTPKAVRGQIKRLGGTRRYVKPRPPRRGTRRYAKPPPTPPDKPRSPAPRDCGVYIDDFGISYRQLMSELIPKSAWP